MDETTKPEAAEDPRKRRTKVLSHEKEPYVLAALLFVVAIAAGTVLHHADKFSFYYFGDASSHVIKAREFTDALPNQLFYIGTTWLPLPHLLLLPFTSVDSFFFSGIAGAFVGIPCLVGTGVLLFLLIKETSGSSAAAMLMASLFGLNPNIVYMALTPMDESSLIFFVTLGGYGLYRWLKRGSSWMLFLSAFAVMLASLCRYEAWPLAPLLFFAAASEGISLWRSSRKAAAVRTFSIAAVGFLGMAVWLVWHAVAFSDPIKFAQGTYSALPDYYRKSDQHLPSKILSTYARAMLDIFGPVLILIAARAYAPLRKIPNARNILLLLLFFMLPMFFTLSATLAGYVGIDEWWWNWRYVLTFGLFLAVAGGIGFADLYRSNGGALARRLVATGLFAMPVAQLFIPSISVATFRDAAKCISPTVRDAMHFGEDISGFYQGGTIALMTEDGCADKMKIASGVPIRFFHRIPFPLGSQIPDSILRSDQYVLIEKNRARDAWTLPPHSFIPPDYLPRGFDLLCEDSCFTFLERSPALFRTILSDRRTSIML